MPFVDVTLTACRHSTSSFTPLITPGPVSTSLSIMTPMFHQLIISRNQQHMKHFVCQIIIISITIVVDIIIIVMIIITVMIIIAIVILELLQ